MKRQEKEPNTTNNVLSEKEAGRLRGAIKGARTQHDHGLSTGTSHPAIEAAYGLGMAALAYPLAGPLAAIAVGSLPTGVWAMSESNRCRARYLPDDGYGVQIFSTSNNENVREARMAVLPRRYEEDEGESEMQRRERLATVVGIAQEIQPDHVVIPNELLSPSRAGNMPLTDALYPHRSPNTVSSPFSEDARGRLFTVEELAAFVERFDETGAEQWEEVWGYVSKVVEQRFPEVNLLRDRSEVLRSLVKYRARELQNMPSAYRESSTDSNGRRLFDREKKYISYAVRPGSTDGHTVIDGKDSRHMVVESKDLHAEVEKIIANPETAWDADAVTLLDAAHFTLAKIVANQHHDDEIKTYAEEPGGIGRKPKAFESNWKSYSKNHLKMRLGAAALLIPIHMGIAHGAQYLVQDNEHNTVTLGEATGDAPLWKIEEHGLSGAGHYANAIYYNLDTDSWKWNSSYGKDTPVRLPDQLNDSSVPHVTLSHHTFSERDVKLPIRDFTKIAALRVENSDGMTPQFTVNMSKDGMYGIKFKEKTSAFIQYDLVSSSQAAWKAQAQLNINGKPEKLDIRSMQLNNDTLRRIGKEGGLEKLRSYISDNYVYSNKKLVKLEDVRSVESYINIVDSNEKVNCNLAATQMLALYAARDNEHATAGFAEGYNVGKGETFMYQGHAFPVFDDGFSEPTPSAPEGVDVGLDTKSSHKLEEEWGGKNKRLIEGESKLPYVLGIGGAGILAAAGVQYVMRRRRLPDKIKRAYYEKRAQGIDPAKAAQYMGWLGYGTYASKIAGTAPALKTIHDKTVRDVTRGEFPDGSLSAKESRSLRFRAKAIQAERRLADD